ncbi:unnamed protein product [Blepharisma stoltei]|uniref:Cyclic nucleotide-binding domain-containing protein n=1 Tax=Blepharisma stoltei TaxID=1481888 RepID=A0AAU9JN14_9CILI|nr:unnamed protein product [Blepharisma stoltei]
MGKKKNLIIPEITISTATELVPFITHETSLKSNQDPTFNSFSFDDLADSTLTERWRNHILSRPVMKIDLAKKLQRAVIRVRGVLLWLKMIEDIKTYGTSACLFGVEGTYKKNISNIVENNQVKVNTQHEVAVTKAKIIYPNSKFKKFWNPIVLIGLLYTFTLMPYSMAFENDQAINVWTWLDYSINAIFIADIIVILNTAYYDKDGVLVTSRKAIFYNYAKSMLIIDIISVIPFSELAGNKSNVFVRFLRLSRITKIVRARTLASTVKFITQSETLENLLKTHHGISRLVSGLIIIGIIAHFIACIWIYSAKLDDFGPDTWIVRYDLHNSGRGRVYLTALYWAITVLTTVGFGDIHALTETEMLICIIWMLFGVGFYSFIVGTITSVMTSLDEKAAKINGKLLKVDLFAKDTMIPKELADKIKKTMKDVADLSALDESEKTNIILHLPKKLRYGMAIAMYDNAIKTIDFFRNKDESFIADIALWLKFLELNEHDYLYKYKDYADEVYFLIEGRIGYVYGTNNFVFKNMIKGSYFGEIEIIDKIPRKFTVMATEKCSLFVMKKQIFDTMMMEYPSVASSVKSVAEERKRRNTKAMNEIIDLMEIVELKKEFTFDKIAGMKKSEKAHKRSRSCTQSSAATSNAMDMSLRRSYSPSALKKQIQSKSLALKAQTLALREKAMIVDEKIERLIKALENENRPISIMRKNSKSPTSQRPKARNSPSASNIASIDNNNNYSNEESKRSRLPPIHKKRNSIKKLISTE